MGTASRRGPKTGTTPTIFGSHTWFVGRAQHRGSRLTSALSASAWLAAVGRRDAAIAIDQARPNPRGTGLDGWFGVKRRHTWDDDLLGTALILTATVCVLSIMALVTKSPADKRRDGARHNLPLIVLASLSVVALAIFGSVLSEDGAQPSRSRRTQTPTSAA